MQHISTDTLYKLQLKRQVNLSGTGRNFTHFFKTWVVSAHTASLSDIAAVLEATVNAAWYFLSIQSLEMN